MHGFLIHLWSFVNASIVTKFLYKLVVHVSSIYTSRLELAQKYTLWPKSCN